MAEKTSFHQTRRASGFTLVEITVVLGIAAVLTAITMGSVHILTENNRKASCQTNLTQLYMAARLYSQDEGGGVFPAYDPTDAKSPGLWALYSWPDPNQPNGLALHNDPLYGVERYTRTPRILHCPDDVDNNDDFLLDPNSANTINRNYLSYQVDDGGTQTYQPKRVNAIADPDWKRQILHYDDNNLPVAAPPLATTIVTWCKFHRSKPGGKDNVLFYDGSVRRLDPSEEYPVGSGTFLTGWRRMPE